ncbi:MAG TPA: hypothetical protein VMT20_06140 [Terriglobia bacterium]|nr:hypothetical protein [Terriglobia bacterium]
MESVVNQSNNLEPYWQAESDWLCTVEFLPVDDPEGRHFAAEIIGYLFGYAQLTNTRMVALLGNANANAYELLFSFSSPEEKARFLDLIRSNEDMGSDYLENDFLPPTADEIKNARPLAMVLPKDVVSQVTLVAAGLLMGSGFGREMSPPRPANPLN